MLPNFLGIGAPKSATTWLHHCLREHPEVFVAESKEVMFFDYGDITGRLGTYEEHFSGAGRAKAVGEFSTRYLASSRAPERVKRLIPDAKLIVSLRCPVDQIYSHYWHLRKQNFHGLDTSSEAPSFERALIAMENQLMAPAYYFRNLCNWLEHFDRAQIHVILYDDIQRHAPRVLKEMYAFLGVDDDFIPAASTPGRHQMRRGGVARSALRERLHRSCYTSLVKYVYRPMKATIGVRRADRLKSTLRVRETLDSLFYDTAYPRISSETRERISGRFDSDVRKLSELLGRPLEQWLSGAGQAAGKLRADP